MEIRRLVTRALPLLAVASLSWFLALDEVGGQRRRISPTRRTPSRVAPSGAVTARPVLPRSTSTGTTQPVLQLGQQSLQQPMGSYTLPTAIPPCALPPNPALLAKAPATTKNMPDPPRVAVDPSGNWVAQAGPSWHAYQDQKTIYTFNLYHLPCDVHFEASGSIEIPGFVNNSGYKSYTVKGLAFQNAQTLWLFVGWDPFAAQYGSPKNWLVEVQLPGMSYETHELPEGYMFKEPRSPVVIDYDGGTWIAAVSRGHSQLLLFNTANPDERRFSPSLGLHIADLAVSGDSLLVVGWNEVSSSSFDDRRQAAVLAVDTNDLSIEHGPLDAPRIMARGTQGSPGAVPFDLEVRSSSTGAFISAPQSYLKNEDGSWDHKHTMLAHVELGTGNVTMNEDFVWEYIGQGDTTERVEDVIVLGAEAHCLLNVRNGSTRSWTLTRLDQSLQRTSSTHTFPGKVDVEPHPRVASMLIESGFDGGGYVRLVDP